ncbi:exported hypothetical protein [metagenome]|uniref:Uncharacterized protein n=1 Tax=metagenome TaxID=256318 RepID=A0A2P2C088_9ZZZZ
MLKIMSAAAAIALAGVLAACSDDEPPTGPAADESQPATAAATPDCPPVAGDHNRLDPGCWAIQAEGVVESPLAQLQLPAGFSGNDAWVWVNDRPDKWGAITMMMVGDVYRDACTRTGGMVKVGGSVQDFASALAAQKATTTTTPVPVSLDGHEGVYLEMTVPADTDLSRCVDDSLSLWVAEGGPVGGVDPGNVHRYWVVDMDGQGVVLLAATDRDAPDQTVELFTGIAASATLAAG